MMKGQHISSVVDFTVHAERSGGNVIFLKHKRFSFSRHRVLGLPFPRLWFGR